MLDFIKGSILHALDEINVKFSPYDEFTRPALLVDDHPLEYKAEVFWKDIWDNWRHGPNKEFYMYARPFDGGDSAIWQGVATATAVFKKDLPATEKFLDGQTRLQTLSGLDRMARGADSPDGPMAKGDPNRRYFESGNYIYHQDVSESSLIGHLFGLWAILYKQPSSSTVTIARTRLKGLAEQVIKDGFILRDVDGKPARFGDLTPSVWTAPIRLATGAVLFLMAYKATGKKMFKEAYELYKPYRGSLRHPETHFLWRHPKYQDILAYMTHSMLVSLEDDPRQRDVYYQGLCAQWDKNKEEGNPFFTFMAKMCDVSVSHRHQKKAVQILREFSAEPMKSKQSGSVKLSTLNPVDWGGKDQARQPIPPWQRPPSDYFWQRSAYSLSGHSDHNYNCLDFLTAYYIGKDIGAIL